MDRETAARTAEKAAEVKGNSRPEYMKPATLVLNLVDSEKGTTVTVRSRLKCLLSKALLHTLDDMNISYRVLTQ